MKKPSYLTGQVFYLTKELRERFQRTGIDNTRKMIDILFFLDQPFTKNMIVDLFEGWELVEEDETIYIYWNKDSRVRIEYSGRTIRYYVIITPKDPTEEAEIETVNDIKILTLDHFITDYNRLGLDLVWKL